MREFLSDGAHVLTGIWVMLMSACLVLSPVFFYALLFRRWAVVIAAGCGWTACGVTAAVLRKRGYGLGR
jgi:hypothetical protein